jgi:hypothetical protein
MMSPGPEPLWPGLRVFSSSWPVKMFAGEAPAFCAGFRPSDRCGLRYGRGGPGSRRRRSGRRASVDTPTLDRRVSEIRVIDPHHPLHGNSYPVSDRRSGRGPALIVVRLPDGRERAISRSATDFAAGSEDPGVSASRQAHISVRTLLPLANHVRAVLASRNADLEGSGGRDLDQTPAKDGGVAEAAAAPVAAACRRDTTSARAARGTARAAPAPSVDPVGGESAC